MIIVVVLDMDETLGVFSQNVFHPRPKLDFMVKMLRMINIDIILWSLGKDDYVRRVVNGYLPSIESHAYKIFAYSEARVSKRLYGYYKAAEHIRNMYPQPIFLIGVDDKASTNMNEAYDIRIHVPPYEQPEKNDRHLLDVCEKIVDDLSLIKELTPDIELMDFDYY